MGLISMGLVSIGLVCSVHCPVKISKGFVEITHQVRPRPVSGVVSCDQDIVDSGAGTRRKFNTRKRTKPSPGAIPTDGIASFLGSGKSDSPAAVACARRLENKAGGDGLDAAVARCQKTSARGDADQSGQRSGPNRLGRQACTALGATGAQYAAAANSCGARTKAVATLANKNTRLVGAFHGDAPFAELAGYQKLWGF